MALLEAKLGKHLPAPRPVLRVVRAEEPALPAPRPINREAHLRMIRALQRAYRGCHFDLIVAQATLGPGGLDALADDELAALHAALRQAMDCVANDVSFYDAGLLSPPGGEPCCCNGH